jgi:hypothetical protein
LAGFEVVVVIDDPELVNYFSGLKIFAKKITLYGATTVSIKRFPGTNTLAYFARSKVTKNVFFFTLILGTVFKTLHFFNLQTGPISWSAIRLG